MTFENLRCQFIFSSIDGLTRIACGKRRSSYLRSGAASSTITPRAVTRRVPKFKAAVHLSSVRLFFLICEYAQCFGRIDRHAKSRARCFSVCRTDARKDSQFEVTGAGTVGPDVVSRVQIQLPRLKARQFSPINGGELFPVYKRRVTTVLASRIAVQSNQ